MKCNIYNEEGILVACDEDSILELLAENGYEIETKKEKNPAHDWPTYIEQAKKTGLESPIPYKVIPYKNGVGIKKIEFFKPIKNGSL